MQLNADNSGDLFFNQILSFKQLQILGCHFDLCAESTIQNHIKFRHRMAHLKLMQMEAKLAQICKTIKDKNPALISQICKDVQRLRPYGMPLDTNYIKKEGRKNSGPKSNRSRTSGRSKMSKRSHASGSIR